MDRITIGTYIWLAFIGVWSYTLIHMFGYNSIDGMGEPKIVIEDEDDDL